MIWSAKANVIMKELCALNIGVVPFDFGGGKGKYINNAH
jgi:hypothetical protein